MKSMQDVIQAGQALKIEENSLVSQEELNEYNRLNFEYNPEEYENIQMPENETEFIPDDFISLINIIENQEIYLNIAHEAKDVYANIGNMDFSQEELRDYTNTVDKNAFLSAEEIEENKNDVIQGVKVSNNDVHAYVDILADLEEINCKTHLITR